MLPRVVGWRSCLKLISELIAAGSRAQKSILWAVWLDRERDCPELDDLFVKKFQCSLWLQSDLCQDGFSLAFQLGIHTAFGCCAHVPSVAQTWAFVKLPEDSEEAWSGGGGQPRALRAESLERGSEVRGLRAEVSLELRARGPRAENGAAWSGELRAESLDQNGFSRKRSQNTKMKTEIGGHRFSVRLASFGCRRLRKPGYAVSRIGRRLCACRAGDSGAVFQRKRAGDAGPEPGP